MTQITAKYIDHMGSDLSVINSAYASFNKQVTEYNPSKHDRLIQYLARGMSSKDFRKLCIDLATEITTPEFMQYKLEEYRRTPTHHTPFCHTSITLQCKAPIAIHAQVVKHTVGFTVNTTSRRYISSAPELFTPEFRTKPTGNIKQGSGGELEAQDQNYWQGMYNRVSTASLKLYDDLINVANVAPEQARFILPQGVMTEWVWTGSLYAFARFYNQRTDSHAQQEIRDLAYLVGDIIAPLFPVSWKALLGDVFPPKGDK